MPCLVQEHLLPRRYRAPHPRWPRQHPARGGGGNARVAFGGGGTGPPLAEVATLAMPAAAAATPRPRCWREHPPCPRRRRQRPELCRRGNARSIRGGSSKSPPVIETKMPARPSSAAVTPRTRWRHKRPCHQRRWRQWWGRSGSGNILVARDRGGNASPKAAEATPAPVESAAATHCPQRWRLRPFRLGGVRERPNRGGLDSARSTRDGGDSGRSASDGGTVADSARVGNSTAPAPTVTELRPPRR